MAQARNNGFEAAFAGIGAHGAEAKQPKLMGQMDHHAQLLMAHIELGQCCFLVVAFLALRHQVIYIQIRLPNSLRQGVFVAVGEVGQIALQLHGEQHQLAVQAGLCVNGLCFL